MAFYATSNKTEHIQKCLQHFQEKKNTDPAKCKKYKMRLVKVEIWMWNDFCVERKSVTVSLSTV